MKQKQYEFWCTIGKSYVYQRKNMIYCPLCGCKNDYYFVHKKHKLESRR